MIEFEGVVLLATDVTLAQLPVSLDMMTEDTLFVVDAAQVGITGKGPVLQSPWRYTDFL